jgi:hypothetical protein
MDHQAIDLQMEYLQEHLLMPTDNPGLQSLVASFVNHRVLLVGNDSPGCLGKYDCRHEPFRYLKRRVLVLKHVVISTGLWLRNTMVSTYLGKLEYLGGNNIRLT